MKITEEDKNSQFLKWIYGDNIPDDLVKIESTSENIGYSLGKPDVRRLVEAVLKIMNS